MGQSIQGRPGAATLGRSRTIVFPRFTESLPIASPNHSAKDRSGAIHLANGMTSGDSNQVAPCPPPCGEDLRLVFPGMSVAGHFPAEHIRGSDA